jgi:quercetin dioxygenase-like cupin family protein
MKQHLLALSLLLAIPSALYPESYDSSVQVQENLSTTTTWDGASIHYPPGTAKVAGAIVTLAPGAETGWHMHPVPCLALILEGELLVELKDGRTKKLKAGDTLAEVINTPHNGKNIGKVTLKIAVFYAGNTELKTTVLCP